MHFWRNLAFLLAGLFLVALFQPNSVAATNVSGTISSNTTWTAANSPYNLTGNVTVTGGTLTIEPGVQVRSNGNYYLRLNGGNLDVNGTSDNHVIFTHNTSTSVGAWFGVYADNASSTLTIDYADFSYADYGVRVEGASATIQDSTFTSNEKGIDASNGSNLTTARNVFNKNTHYPLGLNADMGTVSFGTGADADSLGTGANLNAVNAIGLGGNDTSSSDCPANACSIPQRTFAGITNIPYFLYNGNGYTISDADAVTTIDAGVVIKFYSAGLPGLTVSNGSDLDVNGSNGNEVIFTDYRDDTYGGDTNNDGSATQASNNNGGRVRVSGSGSTGTIDFAHFRYLEWGFVVTDSGTATVNDSVFQSNDVGIDVSESAGLTTARNTFNAQTYTPVVLNPGVGTVTFGSGADVDSLGTGANLNGFNAIGMSYSDSGTSVCPSDICSLSQRTFAGISNIPYLLINDWAITGSNDTLQVDQGVIVKFNTSIFPRISVGSGADLDVNGTSGNTVVFTDYRDDTVGGDTNNNGSANSPAVKTRGAIQITHSSSIATVDYADFRYLDYALAISAGTATVNDSIFTSNNVGIAVVESGSLTTARNTFNKQVYTPIVINPEAGTVSLGSGANVDTLGTADNINGYNAIGIGYFDNATSACPSDACSIPQRSFAGITNIPYVLIDGWTTSGTNDTTTINAGVVIKHRSATLINQFKVTSGASLDVNGSSGNPVIFTSDKDDAVVGDTNNDGSTAPSYMTFDYIYLSNGGSHTIDYLTVKYLEYGVAADSSTTLVIQDSSFLSNNSGLVVNNRANVTTARNTFSNNQYPLEISPDSGTVTLGSGANADILSTGGAANTYNAIAMGPYDSGTNDCPSNTCTLSQRTFAGITNIPYLFQVWTANDSDGTFVIDPGVIVKFESSVSRAIFDGVTLDINGTQESPVIFTSVKDDTYGGDTNNDATATVPAAGDWWGVLLNGPDTYDIDYLTVRYTGTQGFQLNDPLAVVDIYRSTFEYNTRGVFVQAFNSFTISESNFKNNQDYALFNATATTVNAQNLYWGATSGPNDTDTAAGACFIGGGITANGTGDRVNDTAATPIDYCPHFAKEHPNNTPTALSSNISGLDDVYPGVQAVFTATYSDVDGAADLDRLYLKIDHPTATDIEYYAVQGSNASNQTPVAVAGSDYVESIRYDRTAGGTDINITWYVTLDWDWTDSTDIEFGVKAIDDYNSDSGYSTTTTANKIYDNEVTFEGTLTATGETQGALTDGQMVRGEEQITWSGMKVVFQGTTDVYPDDSDFDVQVADDDDGVWTDTTSSGENFSIVSTTDAVTDASDLHTISVIGLPTGGTSVLSPTFTLDIDADEPVVSNLVESNKTTTALQLDWETDQDASTQVRYGLVESELGSSTVLADTSPRVTAHTANLSTLSPCTKYYYRVRSLDAVGNVGQSEVASFITRGCLGEASVQNSTESKIQNSTGGQLALENGREKVRLVVPQNVSNTDLFFQVKQIEKDPAITESGIPDNENLVEDHVYDLQAYTDPDTNVSMFDEQVSVTLSYLDSEISGLDSDTLKIYHWDGSSWSVLENITVNTSAKTVTGTTDSFSVFGLFGEEEVVSSGSSSSSSSSNEEDASKCTKVAPAGKAATIYAAIPNGPHSMTLYFTEADGPKDRYAVRYGLAPGQYEYGAENQAAGHDRTMTINHLMPNTTYYFQVRVDNGCAVGSFSNEIAGTTSKVGVFKNVIRVSELDLEYVESGESDNSSTSKTDAETKDESVQSDNETESIDKRFKVNLTVLDEEGQPVGGAKIELHSDPKYGTTDENGVVRFEDVEAGQHQLAINFDGYKGIQALFLDPNREEDTVNITVNINLTKEFAPWWVWFTLGIAVTTAFFTIFWYLRRNRKPSTLRVNKLKPLSRK